MKEGLQADKLDLKSEVIKRKVSKADQVKEVTRAAKKEDPIETQKRLLADKVDNEEVNIEEELRKKLEKEGFMSRLAPYNKPTINVVIGTLVSVVQGGIFPVFGLFITKMLFSLFITWDKEKLRSESDIWCLAMFICCLTSFVTGFCQKFLFGIIGENITINVR